MKTKKINVHSLKPGDIIKVDLDKWNDGKGAYDIGGTRCYKVLKLFEHHILCEAVNGYPWRESFQYFKLKNIILDVKDS